MPSPSSLTRREFAKLAAAAPLMARWWPFRPRRRWDGYADAVVIDALASPGPFNVPDSTAQPLSDAMVRNATASGITAVNLTIVGGGAGHENFDGTVATIAYWERELTAHRDVLLKLQSVPDLLAAKQLGRLGLIFGFQDSAMLEGDLDRVELFHRFGVRIIQLTYNVRNLAGDGCLEPANGGLSKFGHALVERLNERRIVVDLSHCGQRTTADAMAASRRPVAITHSGCDAVFAHPRNKRDAELKAMADKGGVIGIYLMPFLNPAGPATTADVIRHIEHAVNVCGEDHVGIGSDQSITPIEVTAEYRAQQQRFGEIRNRLGIAAPREDELLFVPQLNQPRRMEMIADALLERGHPEQRVEKIIGGNFLRLLQTVWGDGR